jgi:hypothetical protein
MVMTIALLVVMRVEVGTQDHLEVVRAHGAVHEHAQRLAREVDGVGPGQHGRVRGEDRALRR